MPKFLNEGETPALLDQSEQEEKVQLVTEQPVSGLIVTKLRVLANLFKDQTPSRSPSAGSKENNKRRAS